MSGKLIAIATLPFSGAEKFIAENYWDDQKYTRIENINANSNWVSNTVMIRDLLVKGKHVVVTDIIFCRAECRQRFEEAVSTTVEWFYIDNDPLTCARNCLHKIMYENDKADFKKEIGLIMDLTKVYQPAGDVIPVRDLRRSWLVQKSKHRKAFPEITKKLAAHSDGLPRDRIRTLANISEEVLSQYVDEMEKTGSIDIKDDNIKLRRRAFLVFGTESSGCRLLTRCLIEAGCEGGDDHGQPFDDKSLKGASELIVWRRSFPHGGRDERSWPDEKPEVLLGPLKEGGYEVRILATIRNHYCTAESQVEVPHVFGRERANENISEAIHRISAFASTHNIPIRYVTYESIVHNTEALRRTLAAWGLFWTPQLTDENAKYLSD